VIANPIAYDTFLHTIAVNHLPTTNMHLIALLALAFPALSAPLIARSTETWSIPTMNVHLMGRDTGIPGNTWPEDRKFNTTLNFTLTLPSSEVTCSANWKYQQVSTTEWPCGDTTGVSFKLSPTTQGTFSDATWTLTLTKRSETG
jgi:hypothetical protein